MRKLLALFALLLSTSAAMAQTDKAPAVTKLPGEEKLSTRERAERDFLMPVRRKKMAEALRVTASAAEMESTAAPELDASTHYDDAAEARAEEVASPARAEHYTAVRYHSRHHRAARHTSIKASTRTKAARTSKSSRTSKATRRTKAAKVTAHRSTKTAARKTKIKTKKTGATHHATAKKKVTKTKSATRKRRR